MNTPSVSFWSKPLIKHLSSLIRILQYKDNKWAEIKQFQPTQSQFNMLLFPLDGCRRFRTHIIANAVNVFNFCQDTVSDFQQDGPIKLFDGCSHSVNSVYGTDDYRPFKGTSVVTNTYGFEVRNNGEVLPYGFVKTSVSKFFTKDCVSFTNCFQTVTSDCTKATNAETRTWERLDRKSVV